MFAGFYNEIKALVFYIKKLYSLTTFFIHLYNGEFDFEVSFLLRIKYCELTVSLMLFTVFFKALIEEKGNTK